MSWHLVLLQRELSWCLGPEAQVYLGGGAGVWDARMYRFPVEPVWVSRDRHSDLGPWVERDAAVVG